MKHLIKHISSYLLMALVSYAVSAAEPGVNTTIATKPEKLPITDLERFTTVIEHIENYYVKPVDDSELFENAIRGMLAGLDPHSAYLDKAEFAELKASTSGKFGGLGVEVTLDNGLIKVITPLDGSPASKAGVKAGDLIVKIDDTPVKDMTLSSAVEKMRGKPGSELYLTIVRKGEDKPLKLKLIREIVNVQSVTSKMLEDGYGYIRISQFQNETGTELNKTIKNLLAQSNGKLKGVILDLRNNPGGVLDASVQVSSSFLDKDKIGYEKMVVYTKGRLAGSQIKEKATGKDLTNGTPLIVLVNGGSASAAEIVAGALQDHKRAVILGSQSFGKGSVQTVLPLKDQRGLKITTALYYTPSGRSIQAKGITPDIVVDELEIPKPNKSGVTSDDLMIHEADLQGHLESKTNSETSKKSAPEASIPSSKTPAKDTSAKKDDAPTMYSDYQLYQALNVLKAQQALQSNK